MSLLKMEYNLYAELKKMTCGQTISLFNEDGDFVEVEPGSSFKFLIPKGFYLSLCKDESSIQDINNDR